LWFLRGKAAAAWPPQRYAIKRGRLRLIPVRELERWLDANASRVLEETR
jgi:hypothetical protein